MAWADVARDALKGSVGQGTARALVAAVPVACPRSFGDLRHRVSGEVFVQANVATGSPNALLYPAHALDNGAV